MTWSVNVRVKDGTATVQTSGDVRDGVYTLAGSRGADSETVTTQVYIPTAAKETSDVG